MLSDMLRLTQFGLEKFFFGEEEAGGRRGGQDGYGCSGLGVVRGFRLAGVYGR